MSRVLVTGGSGFVGRAALKALSERGFEVHAVGRSIPPGGMASGWHRADLFDRAACSRLLKELKPTHLLHFAWFVEHGVYWASPENFKWQTRTSELLTEFLDFGGDRFVAAGTCAEYDWSLASPLVETSPSRPSTPYGKAKAATFRAAMAKAEDRVAWGRIFWAYGPHENERRFVPTLCRALLLGRPAAMGSGHQTRELSFVDDVGGAFAALVAGNATGAVNVGAGTQTSLLHVAERLASMFGRADLLRVGERADSATDPAVLLPSTTRLRDEIGFKPRVDLEEGLERTVAYWRSA